MVAIVDDDTSVRTALHELLRSMGYNAVAFGSAEEFLAGRGHERCDCLITDVHLPGMSGIELVRSLRRAGGALPAVFITAHDDPTTLKLIRQVSAVPHLHKPFSEEELVNAIRRALAA